MGDYQMSYGHSVLNLTVHIVWSSKYRYKVLQGDLKIRYYYRFAMLMIP